MDTQALRDKIRTLLAELESGDAASDAELRGHLQALDSDLHALLARSGDPALEAKKLDDRLRQLSIEFADRHPRLEPILAELANMLANIGI